MEWDEIMKALRTLANYTGIKEDLHKAVVGAIDLIESQQAEIERKDIILESYALQYETVSDKESVLKKAQTEAIKKYDKKLSIRCARVFEMSTLALLMNIRKNIMNEMGVTKDEV